jgi:hypothetical protein
MENSPLANLLRAELAQAETEARRGDACLSRVSQIIEWLQKRGHNGAAVEQARGLLETMLVTQWLHEDHVRHIRDELELTTAPDVSVSRSLTPGIK